MLKKIPSQDSNFDDEFRRIWMEMDRIDPLTPLPLWHPDNYKKKDE
jgi:hypothetical protein